MTDRKYFSGAKASVRPRSSRGRREPCYALERQLRDLLAELRIAVVYGGDKRASGAVLQPTSNPRSWKSYQAVAEDIASALRRLGADEVCLFPDDMTLGQRLRQHDVHLVWLNTGGVQGYHTASHAAAMLEMFGVPYVGHDALIAATLDNKNAFKRVLGSLDIPTPRSLVWDPSRWAHVNDFTAHVRDRLGAGPYIVKPVTGRASLNVHLVETGEQLGSTVETVNHLTENLVLVETFLSGREYCVAVTGGIVAAQGRLHQQDRPFAFSAVERTLAGSEHIFTSMDQRPINPSRFRLLDPHCDAVAVRQLSEMACKIYDELSLQSIIRLDVRADAAGCLHVLEANPKPDLKAPADAATSLVCAGLSQIGMTYDDLIFSLLADRLHFLFRHRPASVPRLAQMVGQHRQPRTGFATS